MSDKKACHECGRKYLKHALRAQVLRKETLGSSLLSIRNLNFIPKNWPFMKCSYIKAVGVCCIDKVDLKKYILIKPKN